MPSVTIWTLESDNDAKAVKWLAEKLIAYLQLGEIVVRAVGRSAIPKRLKGQPNTDIALKKVVELYLQQDDCLIFVIDRDGPISAHQRKQEPNSFINQVHRVLKEKDFNGRVYLVEAVMELEAWLLIDCEGILCYFASKRTKYKQDCRQKIRAKPKWVKFIDKYQPGNTELIVEPEMGSKKGVKEYLIGFSREILSKLNPNLKYPPKDGLYSEASASLIAEYIEINQQTVKRNASFQKLGDILAQYKK